MDFFLAIDIDDARLFTQYAEFGDLLRTHLGARFGRRHPPQPGSSVVQLNDTRRTIRLRLPIANDQSCPVRLATLSRSSMVPDMMTRRCSVMCAVGQSHHATESRRVTSSALWRLRISRAGLPPTTP